MPLLQPFIDVHIKGVASNLEGGQGGKGSSSYNLLLHSNSLASNILFSVRVTAVLLRRFKVPDFASEIGVSRVMISRSDITYHKQSLSIGIWDKRIMHSGVPK